MPVPDITKISTEELMRMRAGDGASGIESIPTEQLLKMKGSDYVSPTGSFSENVKAGAGKTIVDLKRGIEQSTPQITASAPLPLRVPMMLGNSIYQRVTGRTPDVVQAEIDESRKLDAPLMATGGGKVGAVAATLPAAFIPGANTYAGAATIGSILGFTRPTSGDESRLQNTVTGGALGVAGKYVGDKVVQGVGSAIAKKTAQNAQAAAQNAPRDAVLAAGREAGYVVPPSSVKPGLVNDTIESVGGKIATEHTASVQNQRVTDTLARQYLGMADDAIFSRAAIADAKKAAAEPYRQIAAVSDDAAKALDAWKQANFDAKMQWNYFRKSGNPEAYTKAQELGKAAEAALDSIEKQASPAAVEALKAARVQIGKLSTIESAMTSGGHVDARVIAKMGERFPFTDQLKLISDFAAQFPKAMKTPEKIGGAGVHALRSTIGAGVGTLVGGPAGTAVGAAAGVAVPWSVRKAMLSGVGQSAMTTPDYAVGALLRGANAGAPLLQRLLPATTVGGALANGQ